MSSKQFCPYGEAILKNSLLMIIKHAGGPDLNLITVFRIINSLMELGGGGGGVVRACPGLTIIVYL